MRKKFRESIAARLFMAVLLFSMACILTTTAIHFFLDYRAAQRELDQTLDEVEKTFLPALENSLWLMDRDQLRIEIEGLLQQPYFEYCIVRIRDETFVSAGTMPTERFGKRDYPLRHFHRGRVVALGTLSIYTDRGALHDKAVGASYRLLLQQTAQVFIISFFILFIVRSMVTRHLTAMAAHVSGMDPGRLGPPLALPARKKRVGGHDELDLVVCAINDLSANLQDTFARLKTELENLHRAEEAHKLDEERSVALLALHGKKNLSEQELSDYALEEAVRLTRSKVGYLHLVAAGEQELSLFSWSKEVSLLCKAEKIPHYPLSGAGIWADCVRLRAPAIHNDYPDHPERKGYPEGHFPVLKHMSVPVFDNDRIVAVVGVGNKESPYDESDARQLSLFFASTWDIIRQMRAAEEKKLMERQLRQAQKMEAIGTLAGGIAHDFNNILSIILGFADLLQEDLPAASPLREYVRNIVKGGTRAKELVRQILTFSRQARQLRGEVDIGALISEDLKLLRASIPANIEIRPQLKPDCGTVVADPAQINQVLMNLCTNAYHAMEETGGVLEITLARVSLPDRDFDEEHRGTFVRLGVRDSGPGIDPAIQDRIFEPYFTTKEMGKGTGLGLAVVHGVVESHGGFLKVESARGKGARFEVFFPAAHADAPQAKTGAAEESAPAGRKGHILFVDDEEMLREMSRQLLERMGYSVTVCADGLEALETFNRLGEQFDLIVTDQTMPGMTGADFARLVLAARPDMPIILCTGFSSVISEQEAKKMGIKGFVLKPMDKDTLARAIREVLEG